MVASISQYILAVEHIDVMTRTLCSRHITPLRNKFTGKINCSVGNAVIVFEVMCDGRRMALRVYMHPHHNLRVIYGDDYYPKELLVSTSTTEYGLVDVVLCEWCDGVSLQSKIEESYASPVKMRALSQIFERFAVSLLAEEWAHGDLKPTNIIYSEGELRLIDFDAMWREGFSANECVEVGTRQFQHPTRDESNFCRDIDDYPVALIATALAAMSWDSTLGRGLSESDYLLICPALAVEDREEMLERIERLFAENGDVRHYRIAKLLRSQHLSLPQLKGLLEMLPIPATPKELSLEYHNGYWGYVANGRFAIPPLYDLAFDFSEGLALVLVGDVWHFIDASGAVVITCGRGTGIRPFRNGTTHIVREDGEYEIRRDGSEVRV